MAREPIVEIQGNALTHILSVSWGLVNGRDADGRPTMDQNFGGITIQRILDDKTDVSTWAKSAAKADRRDGKIKFEHGEGKTMKTLTWEEGYVAGYNTYFSTEHDFVVESFTVMPRKIAVEGKELDLKWEESH
jgi:hypothetical protein